MRQRGKRLQQIRKDYDYDRGVRKTEILPGKQGGAFSGQTGALYLLRYRTGMALYEKCDEDHFRTDGGLFLRTEAGNAADRAFRYPGGQQP